MPKSSLFFIASLLLVVLPALSLAATNARLDLVGGYERIENTSDPQIQTVGEFAVNEHNNQSKTQLKFQKVISGAFQIVAGTNYNLRLTALDGSVSRTYGTVVFNDLNNKNHLIYFFGISN